MSIIHEYRISTKSRIIYITVILSIIIAFASLPFINIPVSVKCNGVFQAGTVRFEGKLKAYCYINPADIGMIKIGQQVSYQIDALNYNTWGLLSGRVQEISNDLILLDNDVAVYKIQCSMDKDHFELEGSKVYFKKGMSFTARFKIGDLNLFKIFRYKPNKPIDLNFYNQS